MKFRKSISILLVVALIFCCTVQSFALTDNVVIQEGDVNTFEKTLIRNEQGMFPDRKEVLEKAKEVFSDRIGKITYY